MPHFLGPIGTLVTLCPPQTSSPPQKCFDHPLPLPYRARDPLIGLNLGQGPPHRVEHGVGGTLVVIRMGCCPIPIGPLVTLCPPPKTSCPPPLIGPGPPCRSDPWGWHHIHSDANSIQAPSLGSYGIPTGPPGAPQDPSNPPGTP